jgi:hypothetical protein
VTRADFEELLAHAGPQAGWHLPRVCRPHDSRQDHRQIPLSRYASDDPNDLVPHEHRRELRALGVFGAWTNVTDFKAENTLDTILTENGHPIVKHYLQDVGSSFGMCNDIYTWDVSWEHFYQGTTMAKRVASFGFALSPWQTVKYTEGPEIGKFEGDRFDPRTWLGHTPNAAVMEMRDDDAFWAAQRVAAFSGDADTGDRSHGRIQRPGLRKGDRRHHDQTARQDPAGVPASRESHRHAAPREQSTLVRECRRSRRMWRMRPRSTAPPGSSSTMRRA